MHTPIAMTRLPGAAGPWLAALCLLALGCVEQATPRPDPVEPTPDQPPAAAPDAPPADPAPAPPEPAPEPEPEPEPEPAPEPEPEPEPTPEPGCLAADGCDAAGVQYLKTHDAAEWDHFGLSVAVHGDRMAVGAPSANLGGSSGPDGGGAVYIFERDDRGDWVEVDQFASVTTEQYDAFGATVALAGDVLVVGAPSEEMYPSAHGLRPAGAAHTVGAAHVFERQPDGTWLESALLRARRPEIQAYFGRSLAFDGTRLVVGAPAEETPHGGYTPPGFGAAYVFERGADGLWLQVAELRSDDPGHRVYFGMSVALDGPRVVVGAPLEGERGAVHVFEAGDAGWTRAAHLTPPAEWEGESSFGGVVAAHAGRVAVGVQWTDPDGGVLSPPHNGRTVFVYEALDAAPTLIVGPDAQAFGGALALSDAGLLIGAPRAGDVYETGAAWLYASDGHGGWSHRALLTPPNRDAGFTFGRAVVFADDVPVVGAATEPGGPNSTLAAPDDTRRGAGAVYVFGDRPPR